MWLKKIVTSLICILTMTLLCSTYSYAATNDSDMKIDLEQNLTSFEQLFLTERSHYNLSDSDIISGNLQLGGIYENNTIDINSDPNTEELSEKLNKTNKYVSTITLKDSNKPIALAYIEKRDSKWVITRINSYNLLDKEVENYIETVDDNPTIIIDPANQIYAIGSENNKDSIRIIESSENLKLKSGQYKTITELQPQLKERRSADNEITTGINAQVNNTIFNYNYLLIAAIFLVSISIFLIVSKKRLRNNKIR